MSNVVLPPSVSSSMTFGIMNWIANVTEILRVLLTTGWSWIGCVISYFSVSQIASLSQPFSCGLLMQGAKDGGCYFVMGEEVCTHPSERWMHGAALFNDTTMVIYGGFSPR